MRLVILESPYAGDIEANVTYARRCVSDALHRGEAPIASHLLYTQPGVLDDNVPGDRLIGMSAGWAWYQVAQACVCYIDRGISSGMKAGLRKARMADIPIEFRSLEGPAEAEMAYAAWKESL